MLQSQYNNQSTLMRAETMEPI
ncbi:protein of unknown function [Nitratireductor aquimarinus]